jgi:FixJ family two-component response regulator
MLARRPPLVLIGPARHSALRFQVWCAAATLDMDFRYSAEFRSVVECAPAVNGEGCLVVDAEADDTGWPWKDMADSGIGPEWPALFAVPRGHVRCTALAISAGALDVLEKPLRIPDLVRHVQAAMRCQRSLHRNAEHYQGYLDRGILKPQEVQILIGLMDSQTNKQLAQQMGLGLRTVEAIRARIMHKLGVDSFVNLIRLVDSQQRVSPWELRCRFEAALAEPES